MARIASFRELETQLELAKRLRFGTAAHLDAGLELAEEVGRMLHALVCALENAQPRR